jgi:hypothetical protein
MLFFSPRRIRIAFATPAVKTTFGDPGALEAAGPYPPSLDRRPRQLRLARLHDEGLVQ